jgi:soluble cytochrome b562
MKVFVAQIEKSEENIKSGNIDTLTTNTNELFNFIKEYDGTKSLKLQ